MAPLAAAQDRAGRMARWPEHHRVQPNPNPDPARLSRAFEQAQLGSSRLLMEKV
ncbi:hypothetical protein HispidOSU_005295 [Sigmodon hispidus]